MIKIMAYFALCSVCLIVTVVFKTIFLLISLLSVVLCGLYNALII